MTNNDNNNSIILIDATSDSLTVSWPPSPDATSSTKYVLQYRKDTEDSSFETLSDKLSGTQARKKNLHDHRKFGFFFRVTTKQDYDDNNADACNWISHEEPFALLTPAEESNRMSAPTVVPAGSHLALHVSWKASEEKATAGYELQMRENQGGAVWTTIAPSLSSTQVKKKNLSCREGYQFRVRPNTNVKEINETIPFSAPSQATVAVGLSEGMKKLFSSALEEGQLLRQHNQPPVSLEDALGGKEFVLLYASAHWCPPCRQFTPKLANWYRALGANNRSIEVVFLSADHDESGFNQYYSTMPWMAIPYDDDGREAFMGHIRVQGIPRLAVLDGKTGRIIEDNAVGKPFDITRWRKLAAAAR